jgi:transposase
MNSHKNALLTHRGREPMVRAVVDGGLSKATVAGPYKTTPKTVAKWARRFRTEGVEGLRNRSSRPLSLPSQTPPATCAVVEVLRRQRHTGKQIAAEVGVSPATVCRILRRLGLNRIRDLSGSLRIPPHAALHRNQPDRVQRQSREGGRLEPKRLERSETRNAP